MSKDIVNLIPLKHLTAREAIADAIHRAVLAFDTNDQDLFQSAWTTDSPVFVRNGTSHTGLIAVTENIFGAVAKLETQHSISNIRIELDDSGNKAHMVTHMIAQHHRPGEAMDPTKKGLLGRTINHVDLVLSDESGLWRMTKWDMNITWIDGDVSIVGLPGY